MIGEIHGPEFQSPSQPQSQSQSLSPMQPQTPSQSPSQSQLQISPDLPPPDWMPQVEGAARRQLEWQTQKRLKLSKNRANLLNVRDEEREVDYNFKRRKAAVPQQSVFSNLVQQFEKVQEDLVAKESPTMGWAKMVNNHIMTFPKDQ